jgi:hypothetical protein
MDVQALSSVTNPVPLSRYGHALTKDESCRLKAACLAPYDSQGGHMSDSLNRIEKTILLVVIIVSPTLALSQAKVSDAETAEAFVRRLSLISEIQSLEIRAKRLDKPLARAAADAEIADALWGLNQDESKNILREAYELTFPGEEQRAKLQKIPVGANPRMPRQEDWARGAVSRRILQVASRDRRFVAELLKRGQNELGYYEAHIQSASLANDALAEGDKDAAGRYILNAIDADPTQIAVVSAIEQLASKDRAAADDVILQFIERLSVTPLSFQNGSEQRVYYALAKLMWPSTYAPDDNKPVAPSAPVIKAYASFMLKSLAYLEQENTGSTSNGWLLMIWPLVKQYAPELTQQFLGLEQRLRKPGQNFSLPSKRSMDEESRASYEKRIKHELEQDQPDENVIRLAISHGDFSKARKLIDKLADGPQKTELIEMLNAEQAISLANKGDIPGALKLAESLAKAASIMKVFPVIAGKCAAQKDNVGARDSVNQAVRQLKKADVTPFTPPPGVPASIFGTKRDVDRVLQSLGSLASAVLSVEDELALDVFDELVIAANHSGLDTRQGRTGFETSLVKKLAAKNEERTTAAALQFQDPLRQIVALAAIEQWKVDKFAADEKLRSARSEPSVKKN